jgi:Secretion system C-terminal sorting domain
VLKCCISYLETLLMKKVHLSIPKPCNENWDTMTPADKGRFCGSCQKAVIDFTKMSDRQIAEFFKKPPPSVCGHFYQDQLERGIELPRKRIPWIKYFFQFSLPAFLFSMRTGAQTGKVALKGDTVVSPYCPTKTSAKNVAAPADSLKKDSHKIPLKKIEKRRAVLVKTKSIDFPNQLEVSQNQFEKIPEIKPTPVIKETCFSESFTGVLGGVVVVSVRTNHQTKAMRLLKDTTVRAKKLIDTVLKKFSVYPNPAQRNSSLNISLTKMDAGKYTISIINLAGEIVQTEEVWIENKKQILSFHLKDIAAGAYFVHLFNRKTAASYSEKIIIE